jgi:hypothetical protein
MGTRHLIAVMVDGQYKVAQYGQWDGYPSGQGVDVLAFLRSADLAKFADKCRATRWITAERCKVLDAELRESGKELVDVYPHLSRDTSAKVLGLIAKAPDGIELRNHIDFAGDSLMCEWAYVIDLDARTFEVFEGFNKRPLAKGERFRDAPVDGNEYQPVRRVAVWPLDALPDDAAFVKATEPTGAP